MTEHYLESSKSARRYMRRKDVCITCSMKTTAVSYHFPSYCEEFEVYFGLLRLEPSLF